MPLTDKSIQTDKEISLKDKFIQSDKEIETTLILNSKSVGVHTHNNIDLYKQYVEDHNQILYLLKILNEYEKFCHNNNDVDNTRLDQLGNDLINGYILHRIQDLDSEELNKVSFVIRY
jgi:hypothetical protein